MAPGVMNPLRTLETTLTSLVEGAFGRLFRSEVRPMELARKLTREMDEHRTASVSRVYVPNEYAVWLSPQDRARYDGVEADLIDELCAYLLEHARAEDLTLASHPVITFHTDPELALGEFGIQARLVRPGDHAGETAADDRRPARALLLVGGRRLLVAPSGAVIGRGRDCDIVLEDAGISRRHAHIRPAVEGWTIEDLHSTNGVLLNGGELRGAPHPLQVGDRIELGSTEIVFELR
jgi:hypothetical protein